MDELEFIRTCATLDDKAWQEFLNRYSRLIYTYIYRVTVNLNGLSRSDPFIDDVYQGLLHSLIDDNARKLRTFKGLNGCSFASWLRLVTVNYTLSCLRRMRPAVSLDEDNDGLSLKDIIKDEKILPDEVAVYHEHAHNLKETVEIVRWVRELVFASRQVLRISRTAVDMRKSRLVERLRECFKRKGLL